MTDPIKERLARIHAALPRIRTAARGLALVIEEHPADGEWHYVSFAASGVLEGLGDTLSLASCIWQQTLCESPWPVLLVRLNRALVGAFGGCDVVGRAAARQRLASAVDALLREPSGEHESTEPEPGQTEQEPAQLPYVTESNGQTDRPVKRYGKNEARDKWLYGKCKKGEQYDAVMRDLAACAEHRKWAPIDTPQGIQQAVDRYIKRNAFDPLPARKNV